MCDPATRVRIKHEMATEHSNWENLYLGSGGASGILVSGIVSITSTLPNKSGFFDIQVVIPGAKKPVTFKVASTAGKIAKRLLARGAVDGVSEGALRQRIHKTDLKRIEFLESDRSGPIWPAFDPLASAETDDFYDLAA